MSHTKFKKTTFMIGHFTMLSYILCLVLISCGGCKGPKAVVQDDSKGQAKDSNVSIDIQQIPKQEKEVYFFQDHPVLAKLKLTREPKAEIIIEDPQNGERVISHMFDENGKYLGVFNYVEWEKKDKTDQFFTKYFHTEYGEETKFVTNKNKKQIWKELRKLDFGISEKESNKVNYMFGEGLKIFPADYGGTIKYFIGTRNIRLKDLSGDGDFDKYWHQTYLFDYTGKLLKIYNYDEMGESLFIFKNLKFGFSIYQTGWDEEWEIKYYRFHDLVREKHYDINTFEIKNKVDIDHSIRDSDFIDMNENYIFMVYPTFTEKSERKDKFLILVFDLNSDLVYYKYFEMKTKPDMAWKFFTKPDGSKIDLSEFDSIKYK